MRIVTSYYTKLNDLDTTGCIIIQVSQSKPIWFDKEVIPMKEVYPDWDIINGVKDGSITEDEYIKRYDEKLPDSVINSVRNKIEAACKEAGVEIAILTCWEGKSKFCHRHHLGKRLSPECVEL